MPIAGIDHVHAVANDLDASIAFYTQVLGFRFLRRVAFGPDDARRELAYVGLGDMLLELVPPVDRQPAAWRSSYASGPATTRTIQAGSRSGPTWCERDSEGHLSEEDGYGRLS